MMRSPLPLIATLLLAALSSSAVHAADDAAAQVVLDFNSAVTAGNSEALLSHLADGSVQFQLRPAHPGLTTAPALTADLQKSWQMVAAIVFPSTQSYERLVTVSDSTSSGDIATVWTKTTTRTVAKDASVRELSFSEVYLLVRKAGSWKIAAIADNRSPDASTIATDAAP